MALNREYAEATRVSVPVPDGTVSGDPLVLGALACVALIDQDDDGEATVQTDGAYRFEVVGQNNGGNAALDVGAVVYLQSDGSIDADTGGDRFGYLLGTVDSGDTTEVVVKIGY